MSDYDAPAAYSLFACHECGLLHHAYPVAEGQTAKCSRCGAKFYRRRRNSIQRALALSLASLVLFGLANGFTFMIFKLEGRESSNILSSGVVELYDQGLLPLAILVALVAISSRYLLYSRSKSLVRSTFIAFARFLICDFSSWQLTTIPDGICVKRMAE